MNVLGISCYYHDSSACLVTNGRVVSAAQEERFTRKKHDNSFPEHASRFCLDWANLRSTELDAVVFYEKPILKFERILSQHLVSFPKSGKIFTENIGSWLDYKLKIPDTLKKTLGYIGKTYFFRHHLSHAASAFYLSGFSKAAIVTIDGVGEWATTTLGHGVGADVHVDREIRFPHSLGLLYSAITAYLGFAVNNSEYKVMGFAAYGDPEPNMEKFRRLITLRPDGGFALNMEFFDYVWSDRMYSKKLEELFGLPSRPKESGVEKQYADIAASLQAILEEAVVNLCERAYSAYKTTALVMSGGVALNSVMNGKILSRTPFRRLYIPPDPGDGGAAIGAALYGYRNLSGKRPSSAFFPYLGPSFTDEQTGAVLERYPVSYTSYATRDALIDDVSGFLKAQKVIGWFQGRMEWGPRALGNRSILAAATKPEMRDIINAKVKHREMFRPFAPVILDEYVYRYFKADTQLSKSAKYMLMVYPFTPLGIRAVPATVHVDGTGRLQTISRQDNPLYYDLIDAYRKKSGVPIILNTSFNVRGEPIVRSPRDAVECFLKTDIDYLVIGNFLVRKPHAQRTR